MRKQHIKSIWDEVKAGNGKKYLTVNIKYAYIKKEEIYQMNTLIFPPQRKKKKENKKDNNNKNKNKAQGK